MSPTVWRIVVKSVLFYGVHSNATPFFKTILEKITIPPLIRIADGLNGYKTRNKNVFKTDPPTTLYIQDAAVNGVHVNNSIEERSNGYLEECIRGARI